MLSVRDLRVSFRTEQGLLRAIDGVSFDVGEGEILGVVGESGSGKTVSLLAVMGLINDPNAVIEGSIKYRGRELVGLRPAEMRNGAYAGLHDWLADCRANPGP
jgi:peptide/nickel transport system ATP-binding protein